MTLMTRPKVDLQKVRWDIDGFNLTRVIWIDESVKHRPTFTVCNVGYFPPEQPYDGEYLEMCKKMAKEIVENHNRLIGIRS